MIRSRDVTMVIDDRKTTTPVLFEVCDGCGAEARDDKHLATLAARRMGGATVQGAGWPVVMAHRDGDETVIAHACPDCAPRMRVTFAPGDTASAEATE